MVNAENYAINPIRATFTALSIDCTKNNLPRLCELVKWQNKVYIVVYIVDNYNGLYNVRCELR
jgi:hypothetical protein